MSDDEIPTFGQAQPARMPQKNMSLDRSLFTGVPSIVPRPGDTQMADRQMREGTVRPAEEPDNLDLDREMWTFFTPTPPVDLEPEAIPAPANFLRQPTQRPLPPQYPPLFPWFGVRECPPYQCPGVWGQGYQEEQETCLTYYETEYTVFKYTVPDTRILIINSIGYEFERAKFPPGDIIEVRVKRDGETLAMWEEFVAVDPPNPALRYTFGSYLHPVPCKVRIDKNQTLMITMVAKGPLPFTKNSSDVLFGQAQAVAYGFLDQLRDTRDGGFKSRVDSTERGPGRLQRIPEETVEFMQMIEEAGAYFDDEFVPASGSHGDMNLNTDEVF